MQSVAPEGVKQKGDVEEPIGCKVPGRVHCWRSSNIVGAQIRTAGTLAPTKISNYTNGLGTILKYDCHPFDIDGFLR